MSHLSFKCQRKLTNNSADPRHRVIILQILLESLQIHFSSFSLAFVTNIPTVWNETPASKLRIGLKWSGRGGEKTLGWKGSRGNAADPCWDTTVTLWGCQRCIQVLLLSWAPTGSPKREFGTPATKIFKYLSVKPQHREGKFFVVQIFCVWLLFSVRAERKDSLSQLQNLNYFVLPAQVKLMHKHKMIDQIQSYDSSECFCEFNEPEIVEIDRLGLLLAVYTACC